MRARNRWGWGFEDAAFSTADARAAAPGLVGLLGFGETEPEEPVAPDTVTLPAPRLQCPPHLRGICTDDETVRATHARGQSYLDTVRGLRGQFGPVPDIVARPRDEREIEAVPEWAGGANAAVVPYGGGTSVVGGVEPRDPGPVRRCAHGRPPGARSRARGRPGLPRGAHRRRRERPADRGAARRPRADAALLPAVIRAVDPRRLDRHPRGRALRHAPHAHRRPRRVGPRRRARGPLGVAPPARVGRGAVARPAAARLGGDPRPHHRGVGPRAAAAGPPRRARRALQLLPRRRRGGPRARPVRARAREMPAHRRARPRRPARETGARRCSRSASSPPTTRSTPGWSARSRSAASTAGATRRPARTALSGRGARRSCACRTCATCSCASASSPTRSSRP